MTSCTPVLTGQAFCVPPALDQRVVWDEFFSARVRGHRVAEQLFLHSGVRTRHAVVDPRQSDVSDWSTGRRMLSYAPQARGLGREAVRLALQDAGLPADEVGLFVVASCTGYTTPGLDIMIADDLGMPTSVQRLVVGHMGCYAAIPGLAAAADYVAGHGRPAVLLCVELPSLHSQPTETLRSTEQLVSHALFADAAAAVVVSPDATHGLELLATAAVTAPGSAALMSWAITDHGFRMGLSPRVPDVLAVHVEEAIGALLKPQGLEISDVAGQWAVHPGGPRIVDVIGEQLRLTDAQLDASREVLAENGNCSSGTVLMVLERIRRRTVLSPGEPVVAMAFGPGLTLCSALLRVR